MTWLKGLLFTLPLLFACQRIQKDSDTPKTPVISTPDTIIGSRSVIEEIIRSAYIKRATAYFVIIGSDTSDFMPIFTESKDMEYIGLDLNLPYFKNDMTYRQRLNELAKILPKALQEYKFDSLTGISVGRLILTGDAAIQVTKQYKKEYGETGSIRIRSYEQISKFLKKSQLAADFNALFKPYGLIVDTIGIEKVFFATKKELLERAKISTDTAEVPEKILDCLTGIGLKKINN